MTDNYKGEETGVERRIKLYGKCEDSSSGTHKNVMHYGTCDWGCAACGKHFTCLPKLTSSLT